MYQPLILRRQLAIENLTNQFQNLWQLKKEQKRTPGS